MASIPVYSSTDEKLSEEAALPRRGCCVWMSCMRCNRLRFSMGSNWWQEMTEDGNRCWYKRLSALKKMKEWSEFVAGPKLKAFIRRFNKQRCRQGKFQYDLTNYLLNFDEGGGHLDSNHRLFCNFSKKYTSILIPGKCSMKFGEDKPTLT